MGPEERAWRYLQRKGRRKWDAQRHEDRLSSGIPDVSFGARGIDGWIELKALEAWPAREDTRVDVGLSRDQALWLSRRGDAGSGRCFVLIRVGSKEWFLFRYDDAMELASEKFTRDELIDLSLDYWGDGIDVEELVDAMVNL